MVLSFAFCGSMGSATGSFSKGLKVGAGGGGGGSCWDGDSGSEAGGAGSSSKGLKVGAGGGGAGGGGANNSFPSGEGGAAT